MAGPSEKSRNLDELFEAVKSFNHARGWDRLHDPSFLAMAISVEAAELLECFQWMDRAEVAEQLRESDDYRARIGAELADILIYLLCFCSNAGIDLVDVAWSKLSLNEVRFPPSP